MTADRADTHQAVADYTASLPTKRMAAAVLFFDDTDRLLLVEPAYTKTYWELPGGCRVRRWPAVTRAGRSSTD
jgi:8-oxo-dGTP diphosphatase